MISVMFLLIFPYIQLSYISVATGVYQNSTFGLAAILPMKYTNAIVLGNVGLLKKIFIYQYS